MTDAERQDALLVEAVEAEAWADLVAAMPAVLADRTGLRVERTGGGTCLVAPRVPFALLNRALGLGCAAPATERDVAEVLDLYRSAGAPRFWIHVNPAARPVALGAWLEARGLALDAALPAWAKLLRGAEPSPPPVTDLRVERVGAGRAGDLGEVLAAAHGMPRELGAWFGALARRDRWSAYAALDGDRVVGGGVLYVSGTRGWLGAGGTLPSHRGRGAHRALMARRIEEALAMGCTVIVTETGEAARNPSLRNMLRCGFRRACQRLNYGPPS